MENFSSVTEFHLPELASPLHSALLVTDAAKISPYFAGFKNTRELLASAKGQSFAEKVVNQVRDVFHSKAGDVRASEFVPVEIPIVTSFDHLEEVVQLNMKRGEQGKIDLHLATPNQEDLWMNLLQVPKYPVARKKFAEIRRELGPGGKHKLKSMLRGFISDGSIPVEDTGKYTLPEYLEGYLRDFPQAFLNLKANADEILSGSSGNDLLYSARKGLRQSQLAGPLYGLPYHTELGLDLYIGSPLDQAKLEKICQYLSLNKIGNGNGSRSATREFRDSNGHRSGMHSFSTIFIGGIGGYGDPIPHTELLDFFERVWSYFPDMKIEIEHGRGAVEQFSYVLVPHDWDEAQIRNYFPDYSKRPDKKIFVDEVEVKGNKCKMVHNVAYLNSQHPEMESIILK